MSKKLIVIGELYIYWSCVCMVLAVILRLCSANFIITIYGQEFSVIYLLSAIPVMFFVMIVTIKILYLIVKEFFDDLLVPSDPFVWIMAIVLGLISFLTR